MKTFKNSAKGFTLVEIMIVVVIIGLLAAMAIPAFQKVRSASQDKTVLNNARQLSAAADQYYLENGVSTVTLGSLVGTTNYVKALNLVANETNPSAYTQGIAITISGVAMARTITYAPYSGPSGQTSSRPPKRAAFLCPNPASRPVVNAQFSQEAFIFPANRPSFQRA